MAVVPHRAAQGPGRVVDGASGAAVGGPFIDRLYRRIGWRTVPAAVAAGWLAALTWALAGGLLIARVERLSDARTLELLGGFALAWLAGATIGLAVCLRQARPLQRWAASPDDQAALRAAWRCAHGFPGAMTGRSVLVGVLVPVPGLLVTLGALGLLSAGLVAVIVLLIAAAVPAIASVGAFGIQLGARPLVCDIAARCDGPPPPIVGGASIRVKLLLAVPLTALAAGFGGALLTVDPGTSWGTVLVRLSAVAVLISVLIVPGTLLLAGSILQPLDDLLQATRRLQRGDFGTPVPELSADEHGVLARSFNDALEGLAERQRLATQNERLLGDVQRLLGEVRASRTRIVEASDAERRRVERNIHDGAQQRLVALALDLTMLEERAAAAGADDLRAMAAGAGASLRAALDEVRELARGLHPSVLATDGLAPALEQLAARAPIPVRTDAPRERFPPVVEATAYFVVCEALANVAKHARASTADVTIRREGAELGVEIVDDGIGGARQIDGSGLAGLADRVAALDGSFCVRARASGGTRVCATLPLGEVPGP